MSIFIRRLTLCLLWLWLPASWAADSGWLRVAGNDHASVRLRALAEGDGSARLLLDVALARGWKTYWRSPGGGGVAPAIAWRTPLTANWRWPTPQRFSVAGIATQGYQGRVAFPLTLTGAIPQKLEGVLTLSTCSNVCILTDYPFALDLSAPADAAFRDDFSRALATVPRADGLVRELSAAYAPGELIVTAIGEADWQRPALYLDSLAGAGFAQPTLSIDGKALTARVAVSDDWGEAAPDLRGEMLSLVLADRGLAQEGRTAIDGLPPATLPLWTALAMALIGGLILNVMPCVLPVLAIKLGAVLQVADADRRNVRRQFFASVAGMLVSFLALALMMTLLRLSGQALGWGIQFQSPWFIGAMALAMTIFSASLLGLFELRLPSGMSTFLATRGGGGLAGHFWQGAFATLLATPCTAPFLGAAVSAALAAPLPTLWGIFLAMGVGMSLPWLLIALWPGLALRLPRPGRWMNTIKIALGLLMLGSALWLLSLLTAHIGAAATLAVAALAALALLAATLRRYRWRVALFAGVAALGIAAAGLLAARDGGDGVLRDRVTWQPLSEQAIQTALSEGKRVFVDVTADWCVTCKANKYNVLLREEVQQALTEPDVVALRGDWSRPSDLISEFLNRRRSAAIPFNQIYGPGLAQGEILPPLLSRESVLQNLAAARGDKS